MSSLSDQSQQWYPTSVQVTVHQARNLRVKGKNGTNDAYAIFQVAKDKFSTSVAEKSVAPVWKEEANFELPLFHQNNAERCTLVITVMHRAQVGLDKFLGQAVVNLLDLHDNASRKKTEGRSSPDGGCIVKSIPPPSGGVSWYKLVDKTGKEDKARGEVLLDLQFMRNNMSASMFDLSMQDKPRSRISKLKDKVRGKKKDGFSDSASAIVPSVSQVLTDSEGEPDAQSLNQSPGVKKKSKLKTLFVSKSNLQRNISQSMSTLGTLPEKNSSLSGSRSSGLNMDSPEVKKKFKFLGHKRAGSTDSKVSLGPFSLLGRKDKHSSNDNNLCINGSHVYAEEAEPKSGSTLSLSSSGQGSVEDVRSRRHGSDVSADSLKALSIPAYRPDEAAGRAALEQQRHQEEEEEKERRRQAEERRRAEAKREADERSRAEAMMSLQEEEELKLQEEQERRRRFLEDEARRKKLKEEEEERQKQHQQEEEEERKRLEAAESRRLEEEWRRQQEEAHKAEEKKRQEEASMSDRLSSLFGMIRKKEEVQQQSATQEEAPKPAPRILTRDLDIQTSHHSTNPFEEIPLTPDPLNPFDGPPSDQPKPVRNPQTPSAMMYLNRATKVSAVKPRLAEALKPEPSDSQSHSRQCPSPTTSESTLSSVPSVSPVMFHNLHSSLAPPKLRKSSSESPNSSIENLSSVASPPTMSETKRKAPQPPAHGVHSGMVPLPPSRSTSRAHHIPIREIENPVYDEQDGSQNGKRPSLPLPDYDTLFPQKRHGVHGFTRWDHIIAEVNQRRRDGEEMSVDGPEEHMPSPKAPAMQERSAVSHQHIQLQEAKPTSTKKLAAPTPPKPVATTTPRQVVDSSQKQSQGIVQALPSVERPDMSALPGSTINTDTSSRDARSVIPKDGVKKALHPTAKLTDNKYMLPREMPRPATQRSGDKQVPAEDQNEVPIISTRQTLELAAPTPPKPVATTTPRQVVDSSQKQNQGIVQALPSVERPDMSALPGSPINTDTSSRDARSVMPKDGVKKALHPAAKLTDNKYMLPREVPRPATQRSGDKQVPAEDEEDENEVPIISTRQTPTAKPRQKTPMKQPDVTPVASSNTLNSNTQILSHPAVNDTDKKIRDTFSQSDPFPSTDLLPKDPWEQLDQNPSVDDIFTRGGDRQQKLEHQGLTSEDLDHIFTTDNPADPFSIFHGSDSEKHSAQGKKDVDSNQHSSTFQRQPSLTKMKMHQFQSHSVKDAGIQHNHTPKEEMANQSLTTKQDPTSTESFTRPHQGNVRMQNGFHGGERVETHCREDPFGPGPLTVNSSSPMPALTTPEPFQLDGEEPTSQAGGLPGGKTLLRAWVSPSEVQPHSAQNSNGGGLGSTPRRPHPVKPLSAVESPQPINTPAVREIKIHDSTVGKKKVPDSVETGPYTQLTQEELITLVVKQQAELSKKDAKIMELEEYIDNLLVRVIEEKPSILLSLTDGKPA